MYNVFKLIGTFILSAILTISFTGCGEPNEDEDILLGSAISSQIADTYNLSDGYNFEITNTSSYGTLILEQDFKASQTITNSSGYIYANSNKINDLVLYSEVETITTNNTIDSESVLGYTSEVSYNYSKLYINDGIIYSISSTESYTTKPATVVYEDYYSMVNLNDMFTPEVIDSMAFDKVGLSSENVSEIILKFINFFTVTETETNYNLTLSIDLADTVNNLLETIYQNLDNSISVLIIESLKTLGINVTFDDIISFLDKNVFTETATVSSVYNLVSDFIMDATGIDTSNLINQLINVYYNIFGEVLGSSSLGLSIDSESLLSGIGFIDNGDFVNAFLNIYGNYKIRDFYYQYFFDCYTEEDIVYCVEEPMKFENIVSTIKGVLEITTLGSEMSYEEKLIFKSYSVEELFTNFTIVTDKNYEITSINIDSATKIAPTEYAGKLDYDYIIDSSSSFEMNLQKIVNKPASLVYTDNLKVLPYVQNSYVNFYDWKSDQEVNFYEGIYNYVGANFYADDLEIQNVILDSSNENIFVYSFYDSDEVDANLLGTVTLNFTTHKVIISKELIDSYYDDFSEGFEVVLTFEEVDSGEATPNVITSYCTFYANSVMLL